MKYLLLLLLVTESLFAQAASGSKPLVYSREAPVLEMMETCNTSALSPGRRLLLARQITRIGGELLKDTPLAVEFFPVLLCNESTFNPGTKDSPVGAVGIAQIMPQFAAEFAEECGLGVIHPTDIKDTEVNLTVGICRFRALIRYFKGNVPLAMAGYNAGRDSPSVKRLKQGLSSNPETDGYLAKAWVISEKYRLTKGTK